MVILRFSRFNPGIERGAKPDGATF